MPKIGSRKTAAVFLTTQRKKVGGKLERNQKALRMKIGECTRLLRRHVLVRSSMNFK